MKFLRKLYKNRRQSKKEKSKILGYNLRISELKSHKQQIIYENYIVDLVFFCCFFVVVIFYFIMH